MRKLSLVGIVSLIVITATITVSASVTLTSTAIINILGNKDTTSSDYRNGQTNAKVTTIRDNVNDSINQINTGKGLIATEVNNLKAQNLTNSSTFAALKTGITVGCNAQYNAGYASGVTEAKSGVDTSSKCYTDGYDAGYNDGLQNAPYIR